MNEQINELMQKVNYGIDALAAQAPEVAEQMVLLGRVYACISIVVLLASLGLLPKLIRKTVKDESLEGIMKCLFLAFALLVSLVAAAEHFAAIVAPKAYLFEMVVK